MRILGVLTIAVLFVSRPAAGASLSCPQDLNRGFVSDVDYTLRRLKKQATLMDQRFGRPGIRLTLNTVRRVRKNIPVAQSAFEALRQRLRSDANAFRRYFPDLAQKTDKFAESVEEDLAKLEQIKNDLALSERCLNRLSNQFWRPLYRRYATQCYEKAIAALAAYNALSMELKEVEKHYVQELPALNAELLAIANNSQEPEKKRKAARDAVSRLNAQLAQVRLAKVAVNASTWELLALSSRNNLLLLAALIPEFRKGLLDSDDKIEAAEFLREMMFVALLTRALTNLEAAQSHWGGSDDGFIRFMLESQFTILALMDVNEAYDDLYATRMTLDRCLVAK